MIDFNTVAGAIFDVDDTLLDNQTPFGLLHEVSRYEAVQRTAHKYNLPMLAELTHEENLAAFLTAKTHSLEGAIWNILYSKGVVDTDEIDIEHELLREITDLKNELHADILRRHGRLVLGAADFIPLVAGQLPGKLAIASSAVRRDIDIVLDEMTNWRQYFPNERVISKEQIPHDKGKPHPEPFNRAFATLGLPNSARPSVLAFEDDPRGIISAKKAGLKVVAVTTRFAADDPALVAARPDLVIASYNDLHADSLGYTG